MDDNGKIFKGAKEKAIELKTMLIFFLTVLRNTIPEKGN